MIEGWSGWVTLSFFGFGWDCVERRPRVVLLLVCAYGAGVVALSRWIHIAIYFEDAEGASWLDESIHQRLSSVDWRSYRRARTLHQVALEPLLKPSINILNTNDILSFAKTSLGSCSNLLRVPFNRMSLCLSFIQSWILDILLGAHSCHGHIRISLGLLLGENRQ